MRCFVMFVLFLDSSHWNRMYGICTDYWNSLEKSNRVYHLCITRYELQYCGKANKMLRWAKHGNSGRVMETARGPIK